MRSLMPSPWYRDPAIRERTRGVVRVLSHHGLDLLVHHSGLRRFGFVRPSRNGSAMSDAERLRRALEELGTAFIKLGQILSTRADLIPPEFIAELSRLQDQVMPVEGATILGEIERELGAPTDTLFRSFDPAPLASASIGQVHGAELPDGTAVVVKVRRPGVVEEVERDLRILARIADGMGTRAPFGVHYDLPALVAEFAYTLRNELDYVREGQNAERLRRSLEGDDAVHIPRVYWSHTTGAVLTLERVGGIKISDLARLDAAGVPRRAVAENAVRIFLREVLEFGFFHADPHPGNFFVQPDGSIAMVDFGMVGRVSEAMKFHLLRAGLAAMEQDAGGLAEELYALGVAGRLANRQMFEKDLDHLIGQYGNYSIRELSMATVTHELFAIAQRNRLQLPADLALLIRVLSMSEGLGLSLDPDFHYLEFAQPYLRRRWEDRRSLRATAARVGRAMSEAAELGVDLPRRTGRLLGRLERGELELNVHHEHLERVTREFQRMTNRLALAVILAASVVALGVAVGIRGLPGIEPLARTLLTLGFAFSLIFGLWLLFSIWRAGRD